MVVLEARGRVGGRVEQLRADGGRPVQLGGEVVGPVHTSYLELADELGLTLEPSYVAVKARRRTTSRRRRARRRLSVGATPSDRTTSESSGSGGSS